ncbi:MAG: hypothetical protein FWG39_01260 [Alphaproteobacteria bacterium]|nr:hypothetical protein [Alphaproteobacteria bacterium]
MKSLKKIMTNTKRICLMPYALCLLLPACQPRQEFDTVRVIDTLVIDERSVPIYPRKAALTTDTARRFALDLPARCIVDWGNQRVLSILPQEDVEMVRLDAGDPLPDIGVNDFDFESQTVSQVLERMFAGTGINVLESEPILDKISGSIASGQVEDATELITTMGKAYYSFDSDLRDLTLKRNARWLVKMPKDQNMIMALVDAFRGANMRNLMVNWEDKTLILEGNYQTEREARQIIADLGAQKYIIAWDIDVYRVYPRSDNPIIWMNMLPAFGQKNVKMSIPGVVGRLLVTSSEINTKTLQTFLGQQSNVVLISQGTFSIPNGWQSRFDIGQCTREERLETDLIIGATGRFGDYGGYQKIDAKIALRTRGGEIASFSVPSSLGDNYVIIGIPTHSFVETPETLISPFAELVVFMSPRVVEVRKD